MRKSLWLAAFVGMTILIAGVAWAWMGDLPKAGQQMSGAEAAVAAPLRTGSVAPLGTYSVTPLGSHSI